MKTIFKATMILLLFPFFFVSAQELVVDQQTTVKAQVIEILKQTRETLPGLDVQGDFQTLTAKILQGDEAGKIVTVENDYINLKKGEVFYLTHSVDSLSDFDKYFVAGPDRISSILFFLGLFIVCVFIFGGKQGIRGLFALVLSFFFILYLLLPGVIYGYSPLWVSVGVASLIIILGSYVTHGFNRTTTVAVIGMITTTILTGILAFIAIKTTSLTGFSSEETTYLNFNTRGHLDFAGLLLGGIIIGVLGILYDAAIGQAVTVEELTHVGPHLSRATIYKRALRIGREHIGALINTLAIAYVGVSLPLLLLYTYSTESILMTINQEMFATEIIRILVGSIGLILTVPVTTFIATLILVKKQAADQSTITKETEAVEELGHHH